MIKNFIFLLLLLIFISSVEAAEKTKISGEYSYTYGDNESIVEAKNICYSMAVRNAIESYKTFVVAPPQFKIINLSKT